MKRICSAALLLTLFLTAFLALPVSAESAPALEELIIDSCTYNEPVDLTLYQLTGDELSALFYELQDSGRLPWYTQNTYTYTYYEDTGIVTKFTPKVLDETVYDRVLYEQKVAEILDATVFEGMRQWQIALSIHDYLIANSTYDDTYVKNEGYDLLVGGASMCNGYAEAYMELMNRAGIPTVVVTSEAMKHGWNLVCIDGNWYHADLTWDDPAPDCYGRVDHKYFLLTDAEISAGDDPHYGWQTDITCTDTAFSDAFWKDVDSRICYADGDTSYLLREDDYSNYIYSRDEHTGDETLLHIDGKAALDIGQGSYYYPHWGLSLWKDKLFFSGTTAVYSMNTDGSDAKKVFSYDAAGNGKHILGCHAAQDTVYLTLRAHDDSRTEMTAPLETSGYHVHSYTAAVTEPTCLEGGKTVHSCACGLTFETSPKKAAGHGYQSDVIRKASLFSDGETKFTCTGCGDSYTEYYPRFDIGAWILENEVRTISAIVLGLALISFIIRKLTHKKKVEVK